MAEITTEEFTALEEALTSADEAAKEILGIYEFMNKSEQRAFDIGGAYVRAFMARTQIENAIARIREAAE